MPFHQLLFAYSFGWRPVQPFFADAAIARNRGPAVAIHKSRRWVFLMLAGAIAAVLIVFALFLSMLSSSPKDDAEWNPDTEA
jgi:lipoprotein signal peptidase